MSNQQHDFSLKVQLSSNLNTCSGDYMQLHDCPHKQSFSLSLNLRTKKAKLTPPGVHSWPYHPQTLDFTIRACRDLQSSLLLRTWEMKKKVCQRLCGLCNNQQMIRSLRFKIQLPLKHAEKGKNIIYNIDTRVLPAKSFTLFFLYFE